MENFGHSISTEHNVLRAKGEHTIQLYSRATQNVIMAYRRHLRSHRMPEYDWDEYKRLNRIANHWKKLDRKRVQLRYLTRGVQTFIENQSRAIGSTSVHLQGVGDQWYHTWCIHIVPGHGFHDERCKDGVA